MVRCAAVNCRSGYKPNRHEEAMLQRGQISPCKKHVFAFQKNTDLRAQWIAAIRRKDTACNPDNCGVSEIHFEPSDFIQSLAPRTKTKRQGTRLRSGVIHSVFKNYPKTARPKVTKEHQTNMATPSARRSHQQEFNQKQIDSSFEEDRISGLDDLYSK